MYALIPVRQPEPLPSPFLVDSFSHLTDELLDPDLCSKQPIEIPRELGICSVLEMALINFLIHLKLLTAYKWPRGRSTKAILKL